MKTAIGACGICGQPLSEERSDLAAGAWDVAVCSRCGRKKLLSDGGVALTLCAPLPCSQFDLGEIQIKPGAIHVLAESGDHYWKFILRHATGDRGQFRADRVSDPKHRPFLAGEHNIVSEYRTSLGQRIWVMTTPGEMTSVMSPGEF